MRKIYAVQQQREPSPSTEEGRYRTIPHWRGARYVEDEISNNHRWYLRRRYSNSKRIGENRKCGIICQNNYLVYFIHEFSIAILHSMEWLVRNNRNLSSSSVLIGPVLLKTNFAKPHDLSKMTVNHRRWSHHYLSKMTLNYTRYSRFNICQKWH